MLQNGAGTGSLEAAVDQKYYLRVGMVRTMPMPGFVVGMVIGCQGE